MLQLQSVINEVADLEPALLALDAAPGTLGVSSSICAPSCAPIANLNQTKVKIVNGQGYVFAYNSLGWGTQTITTNLHMADGARSGNVKGEDRTLTPSVIPLPIRSNRFRHMSTLSRTLAVPELSSSRS